MRISSALLLVLAAQSCDHAPKTDFDVVHILDRTDVAGFVPMSPFSAAETTALRQGFDWASTTPLGEIDEDGHPALYAMLLLVDGHATADLLRLSGLYFDAMPLFPEGLERFRGHDGRIVFEGDDVGTFVFAFVPGRAYNALRARALTGEIVVPVAIPHEVPDPGALLPSGALSYAYLVGRGFTGIGPNDPTRGVLEEAAVVDSTAIADVLRREARAVREAVATLAPATASRRTAVRLRTYLTERRLYFLDKTPHEDESAFFGEDRNLLARTWGARDERGVMVSPEGAQVQIAEGLGRTTAPLDANGYVEIEHPRGDRSSRSDVVLELGSHAATSSAHGLFADRLVLHEAVRDHDTSDAKLEIDIHSAAVQSLAQVGDAWTYAARILDAPPPRARVTDPGYIHPASREYGALCLSAVPRELTDALPTEDLDPESWHGVLDARDDIVRRARPDIVAETGRTARLVPTTHYARYLFCALMRRNHGQFAVHGKQSIYVQPEPTRERPGAVASASFADLFTSQVVGATIHFALNRFAAEDAWAVGSFCDAAGQNEHLVPCIDDNVGGPLREPMGQYVTTGELQRGGGVVPSFEIARTVTTMHDYLDGHDPSPNGETPGNGTGWTRNFYASTRGPILWFGPPPNPVAYRVDPDFRDEPISLLGEAIPAAIDELWRFDHALRNDDWIPAFTRVALARGEFSDEVCALLANHEPTRSCALLLGRPSDDEDAVSELDAVQMRAPIDFVVEATQDSLDDSVTWSGTWGDPSYLHGSEHVIGVLVGNDGGVPVEEWATWMRDRRSAPHEGVTTLPFDTNVTFSIRSYGTHAIGRFGPTTTITIRTPPEPVTNVHVVPTSGGAIVGWSGVEATEYEVRFTRTSTGETTTEPRTTGHFRELFDLVEGESYSVTVTAINAAGTPTAFPSAPIAFEPEPQ